MPSGPCAIKYHPPHIATDLAHRAPVWATIDGGREACFFESARHEKAGYVALVYSPKSGFRVTQLDTVEPREIEKK